MKRIFTIIFVLPLLLSACIGISRPVEIPPGEAGGPPVSQTVSVATKIVELVTMPPPTFTPWVTPDLLATKTPWLTPPEPLSQPAPLTTPQPGSQPADQYPPPEGGGVNQASTPPGPPSSWTPPSLADMGIQAATYHDSVVGFEVDYPAGWVINDLSDAQKKNSVGYSVSLRSKMLTPGPKQEGFASGIIAVDVAVDMGGSKTLAQVIDERRAAASSPDAMRPATIVSEEDWVLQSGLPAHRFLLNLGPDTAGGPDQMVAEVATVIQGHMVLVTGWGDMSLVNPIAASLRAAKP